MSSVAHILEDFSRQISSTDGNSPTDLPGFDDGYNAGWDDATKAHRKTQDKLKSELAQALQENAFTFQEAKIHVLGAIKPLMKELTDKILPAMMRKTTANHVAEALQGFIKSHAPTSLELHVSPEDRPSIELLLPDLSLPVTLTEDATLDAGQTRFAFEQTEAELDCSALLGSVTLLIDDYFNQIPQQEVSHG